MYEEIFRVPGKTPNFLHCCPWWLIRTEGVIEAAGYAYDSDKGNLPAYFSGGNIPVGLRTAMRSYDNGYQRGLIERHKEEAKK